MHTKNNILTQLARSHQLMHALVNDIQANRIIYPGWTIKEVLAHIAGWDELAVEMLRMCHTGTIPTELHVQSIDRYNAQAVEQRKHLTLQETMDDWQAVRQQLLELANATSEEDLTRPIAYPWGGKGNMLDVLAILADHEDEHAVEIV